MSDDWDDDVERLDKIHRAHARTYLWYVFIYAVLAVCAGAMLFLMVG